MRYRQRIIIGTQNSLVQKTLWESIVIDVLVYSGKCYVWNAWSIKTSLGVMEFNPLPCVQIPLGLIVQKNYDHLCIHLICIHIHEYTAINGEMRIIILGLYKTSMLCMQYSAGNPCTKCDLARTYCSQLIIVYRPRVLPGISPFIWVVIS